MKKYCPFNMTNEKASWCTICEVKIHATADCHVNLNNRYNYRVVYQTNAFTENNNYNIPRNTNDQNEKRNQRYEGRRY